MLGVTPCEYVDEHYIANTRHIVLPASENGTVLFIRFDTALRRAVKI